MVVEKDYRDPVVVEKQAQRLWRPQGQEVEYRVSQGVEEALGGLGQMGLGLH